MADDQAVNSRSTVLDGFASIGRHAASATLGPLAGAAGVAAEVGINVERRAVDRMLESGELERLLGSTRVQAVFRRVLESDGAKGLIDSFFDSGLFDRFIERLLASESLWHLVDEVAASPAVTAVERLIGGDVEEEGARGLDDGGPPWGLGSPTRSATSCGPAHARLTSGLSARLIG